jgi:WD40 repeat protein
MDTSPSEHIVITCGSDGSVRCWDYLLGLLLFSEQYAVPARALKWVPLSVDPTARTVVVGFQDGIIRVLKLVEKAKGEPYSGFRRKMVFKPHNSPILDISFSPFSPTLASTSADGTVFFFDTRSKFSSNNSWIPLKFVRILPLVDGKNGAQNPGPAPLSSHPAKIVCEKLTWRMNYKKQDAYHDKSHIDDAGDGHGNGDGNGDDNNVDSNEIKDNNSNNTVINTNKDGNNNGEGVGDVTAVCVCSDGIIREYSLSTIIKDHHELSLTVELSTYETVVRTVERTIRLPVGFPHHHTQSHSQSLPLSPYYTQSQYHSPVPSVPGYATPAAASTTAPTRNGSTLYALSHTVCYTHSFSVPLSF